MNAHCDADNSNVSQVISKSIPAAMEDVLLEFKELPFNGSCND